MGQVAAAVMLRVWRVVELCKFPPTVAANVTPVTMSAIIFVQIPPADLRRADLDGVCFFSNHWEFFARQLVFGTKSKSVTKWKKVSQGQIVAG